MNVVPSLVRRGMELQATHGDKVQANIPSWGVLILTATTILFFGALVMIEYTFGRLIPTLIMVESPADSISFEPLATEDPDSTINKDPEQAPRQELITSSFRRTIRHLHSIGGFRARFRGYSVFFVNTLCVSIITGLFSVLPILRLMPRSFATVIAAVGLARYSLAWNHIMISEPSPKAWFRRLPSWAMWKKVAVPTAAVAIAQQLALIMPLYFGVLSGIADHAPGDVARMTPHQKTILSLKSFGLFVFSLIFTLAIIIPANVVLTRVQASLLSDAEETIVPFDRSFGGKVIPEIVGGSGVLGMRDAWVSFDRASLIRLVKAYGKVIGMSIAVTVLYVLCIVGQLFIIIGNDWSKLFPADGDKTEV